MAALRTCNSASNTSAMHCRVGKFCVVTNLWETLNVSTKQKIRTWQQFKYFRHNLACEIYKGKSFEHVYNYPIIAPAGKWIPVVQPVA
jgi:hypothetical protein